MLMGKPLAVQHFEQAFERERAFEYPAIDAFEARLGFALDRSRLEAAARVLACPVKLNPPNWQHGRVLYALARRYLALHNEFQSWLDIGTAKGFSAVIMAYALDDAGRSGAVASVDVVEPSARVARNSIAEVNGFKTVFEFAQPFLPVSASVEFLGGGSARYLDYVGTRIGLAFVDGKHNYSSVKADAAGIARRQIAGDAILFDDIQIPAVARAVAEVSGYRIKTIEALPTRKYALAIKC